MKLKKRLFIAFFTIVLVPVLLFCMSVTMLGRYQMRTIEENYGINNTVELFTGNSVQLFDSLTDQIREEIKKVIQNNPERFEDYEFLETLNYELSLKFSSLIMRKNQEIVYAGDRHLARQLEGQLPEFGDDDSEQISSYYTGSNTKCLLKQHDFYFPDGSQGTVFIVTPMGSVLPEIKAMLSQMIIAVIVILIFTAFILTTWIYRSIVHPLNLLQKAMQEIKDGNLDYVLDVQDNDEISQLCTDFEEMRIRLKDSAQEKIQYDQESKELLSNISHDLKTPITAIKGYVEGIMDGVASSPEKLQKYIRTIYNKANDMDKLIDELTFYTKIDTNKIPYVFTKINVASYFKDCIEEVGLDLEAKNIELGYFNYTDEDVVVIADAEQLKRVINNIISNSVKYLDKRRGIINIRIKDLGDFIQVEIEDNGRGIAQKDLPFIFDRFYRTDASRNSSQGGSGIGLSIVKKVIEDHGGKIWATSQEMTGTVMHFVLRKYQEVINE